MPDIELTSPRDVFINCPFDDRYRDIFRGLVFTIFACGFRPRSAFEIDDGGQTRIDKLYGIIEECRFGIHDLSRTELDEGSNLPRFNMPLELGIFLGAKRFGDKGQQMKRVLILDTEQYRYQRFISDLAGMDIHAHGSDAEQAISECRNWLANVSRRKLPSAEKVVRIYNRFLNDLPETLAELEFTAASLPYIDLENLIVGWLSAAPEVEAD